MRLCRECQFPIPRLALRCGHCRAVQNLTFKERQEKIAIDKRAREVAEAERLGMTLNELYARQYRRRWVLFIAIVVIGYFVLRAGSGPYQRSGPCANISNTNEWLACKDQQDLIKQVPVIQQQLQRDQDRRDAAREEVEREMRGER